MRLLRRHAGRSRRCNECCLGLNRGDHRASNHACGYDDHNGRSGADGTDDHCTDDDNHDGSIHDNHRTDHHHDIGRAVRGRGSRALPVGTTSRERRCGRFGMYTRYRPTSRRGVVRIC